MTQPSNLKVKRLDELDLLPAVEGTQSWLYAVQDNHDYKVDLAGLTDAIVDVAAEDAAIIVKDDLAESDGASLIGYGGTTVEAELDSIDSTLDTIVPLVTSALQPGDSDTELVFTQNLTGAVTRTTRNKLQDTVHVKDFGAVGDGVTDDTAAIQAAVDAACTSGRALEWGDEDDVYRITNTLTRVNGDAGLTWTANGATILYDSASPTRYAVMMEVTGGAHVIEGKLVIEAGQNAYIGFALRNTEDGSSESHFGSAVISDLYIRNVYRGGTTFAGGDGILINGPWDKIIIERPDILNVTAAAGAIIHNSQGVSGITVTRNANGVPSFRYLSIIDPRIENISSEDDTDTFDMDAIKAFDSSDGDGPTPLIPNESMFSLRGGFIKNCWGRSVKAQVDFGSIDGVKVVRDEGPATGQGTQGEFEFQVGSGSVSNIEFLYNGHIPTGVVSYTASATVGKQTNGFRVRNISGVITPASLQMEAVIRAAASDTSGNPFKVFVSGVDVVGDVANVAKCRTYGTENVLMISDVLASPSDQLVWLWGYGDTASTTKVAASNCYNTGSEVGFVYRDDVDYTVIATASNCHGFLTEKSYSQAANMTQPAVTRVDAIASSRVYEEGGSTGLIRPLFKVMANDTEWLLPRTGFSANTALLLVSVGGGPSEQAIFAVGSTAINAVSGIGSAWTAGTTSDPGSGSWRIWGTAGGIVLKNASGIQRGVTVLAVG